MRRDQGLSHVPSGMPGTVQCGDSTSTRYLDTYEDGMLARDALAGKGAAPVVWGRHRWSGLACVACLRSPRPCHRAGYADSYGAGIRGVAPPPLVPGWPKLRYLARERTILDATTTAAGTRPSLGVLSTGGRNK